MIYVLRKRRRARATNREWRKQGELPWRQCQGEHNRSKWPEVALLSWGVIMRTTGLFSGATEGKEVNSGAIWLSKRISDHQAYSILKAYGFSFIFIFYTYFYWKTPGARRINTMYAPKLCAHHSPHIYWYHKRRLQRLQTSLTQGFSQDSRRWHEI